MQPRPAFTPRPVQWLDVCADAALLDRVLNERPNALAPALRLERLIGAEMARQCASEPETLGVYALTMAEGQRVLGLEPFDTEREYPESSDCLLAAVRVVRPARAELPRPCLDLLRNDTAQVFLEELRKRVAESQADNSPQSATAADVLGLHFSRKGGYQQGDLLWSDDLPRLFEEKHGDKLVDRLPLLWFTGPDSDLVRWRFRNLVATLFEERFLAPLRSFAAECPVILIGRFDPDDSLVGQILEGWGPVARFMEFFPVAGVFGSDDANPSLLAFQQALSAHSQTRPPRKDSGRQASAPVGVQAELFRRPRGQSSLADFWAEAELSLALGAGSLTTPDPSTPLRGDGKRKNGPGLYHQAQPYHSELPHLVDCVGRLNEILCQGERVARVLVLSPADSIMALCDPPLSAHFAGILGKTSERNQAARDQESTFLQILEYLQLFQISMEIADEATIERHGEVATNSLQIGRREYTTIVIPPAHSWRRQTVKLLRRFVRKGGNLVMPRPFATRMDFETSTALTELDGQYANLHTLERPGREVCWQVNRFDPAPYQIKALGDGRTDSLQVLHRRTETHDLFLILNRSRERDVTARVSLAADGAIRVLDPRTPRVYVRDADEEKNAQAFDFTFHAAEATLLAVGGQADLTEPPYQRMPHATSAVPLDGPWNYQRLDPNLLPLKQCRWRAGEDSWSRSTPVDWARVEIRRLARENERVSLLFSFQSDLDGRGLESDGLRLALLMEENQDIRVALNDHEIDLGMKIEDLDEFFEASGADGNFSKGLGRHYVPLDVAPWIRPGANQLELSFTWTSDASLEYPLLAGDFAVVFDDSGSPKLGHEPRTLRIGSWREQGYPFYVGHMRYVRDFMMEPQERLRYFIRLQKPHAASLVVRIGEHEPVSLDSHPHRFEITRLAPKGKCRLRIDIASTLYNVYGPTQLAARLISPRMHLENWDQEPTRDRRLWNAKADLHDYGLLGEVLLETFDPSVPPPPPPSKTKGGDEIKEDAEPDEIAEGAVESAETEVDETEEPEDEEEREDEGEDEEGEDYAEDDEDDEDEDEDDEDESRDDGDDGDEEEDLDR
jgi:hypothetical protein